MITDYVGCPPQGDNPQALWLGTAALFKGLAGAVNANWEHRYYRVSDKRPPTFSLQCSPDAAQIVQPIPQGCAEIYRDSNMLIIILFAIISGASGGGGAVPVHEPWRECRRHGRIENVSYSRSRWTAAARWFCYPFFIISNPPSPLFQPMQRRS